VAVAVTLLAACASRPPVLPGAMPRATSAIELSDTAFFPQTAYQCGPAALATVLHSAGVEVEHDDLADQVYLPARQGSLQVELLAATRRAERIPYVIDPQPEALHAELDAGRPVLVLQNLGLGVLPVWHYAVVIGLDPTNDRVILRSGAERRQLEAARGYLRSWQLGGGWGFVVLRPGELPAEADRARYLHAVALAERYLSPQDRRAAYRAALETWPDDATAGFGLAYALQASGDLVGAEEVYRRLIVQNPRHAAAYNNLADVLTARGCVAQARHAAITGLAIARDDYPDLVDTIGRTLEEIPSRPDDPRCTH